MHDSDANEEESTQVAGSGSFRVPIPRREDLGWLLIGGGIVGAVVTLVRRRRRRRGEWALHLGLICAGAGVLLRRRRAHIERAEENIMAELDALDPIARAQVLKTVAEQQLGRWRREDEGPK